MPANYVRWVGRSTTDSTSEMQEVALRAAGSSDWRTVLEEANENHPRTEEEMRATYADWTERSRQFLASTGLVTLPAGEQCSVEPSPVFQRPVLGVASYLAPPMFSDKLLGHFFVPFAPDNTPEDEIQQRLAGNSFGGIPTTAVHEAYPGHHWHLTMNRVHSRKLRKIYGTPYFCEGWALYAERVMRERGFFTEPMYELYHLEATIFRAARIIVDTSLHMGEMTFDEAVDVHDEERQPAPSGGHRGGWPLLLVADPGVVLPDRLPRDPAHPRRLLRGARCRRPATGRRRRLDRARLPRRDHQQRPDAHWPGRTSGDAVASRAENSRSGIYGLAIHLNARAMGLQMVAAKFVYRSVAAGATTRQTDTSCEASGDGALPHRLARPGPPPRAVPRFVRCVVAGRLAIRALSVAVLAHGPSVRLAPVLAAAFV